MNIWKISNNSFTGIKVIVIYKVNLRIRLLSRNYY